ncbi:failed axon connections homolog [Tubulanus polymorphus]|uniref:failed axon connections homolog n=1 Tax=Tubulanus polymorphus TaxID=672921 RepID=UPI003DA5DF37
MDKETLIASSVLISVAAVSTCLLYKIYSGFTSPKNKTWPRDVVIVFHIGKGPGAPTLSPFSLKLLTYLRMAGIPYQTVCGRNFSSKGKIPWVIYNGTVVEDTEFITRYFNENFEIDLNKHLSAQEKATSLAFRRLIEEHLFWSQCGSAFDTDDISAVSSLMPYGPVMLWVVTALLRWVIRKEMWCHGIGRHSRKDYLDAGSYDLRSLATFLGDRTFLMGDEPSEVDCTVFGFLAQILWHMPNSHHYQVMTEELPNLERYCERMRERFWPDWEEIIGRKSND